ncbi:Ribokinase [Anaerobiospirillum thomasii]|uniref:carbohydrate kinase family protein n=1 Tax=Anaerobiospirillum thomasii TaxID=179995 RepID=UPI000D9A60F2|nr:carbohydrate kinase [Anaerobiospirillum thomasii]SPT72088.1 Ribokinase [Anaerobiospirillum thomasii]
MLDFSRFYNKKIKCAGIGEVLFDVFESGAQIGGAPANFAYHCKNNGLDALLISSVGNDSLGFRARNLLAMRYLPSLLLENSKPTGCVYINLDDNGIPAYTFADDTAYDNIAFTDELKEIASELDLICFGSLAQRSETTHNTIMTVLESMPEGSLKVFDVNLRGGFYNRCIIENSLKHCDIFKCNEDELPVLSKLLNLNVETATDFYAYLKSVGIYCFIFTEGAVQSSVYLNDDLSCIKTPKVSVADTVGAGDSFTATVVSSLIKGLKLKEAHDRAVKVSAYVCTQKGAMPDIPSDL